LVIESVAINNDLKVERSATYSNIAVVEEENGVNLRGVEFTVQPLVDGGVLVGFDSIDVQ
jgi:hypothetical protein